MRQDCVIVFMMAERILRKRVEEDETEMLDLIEQAVLIGADKGVLRSMFRPAPTGLV